MSVRQYTIRKIPNQVDSYLRKQVKMSGKSLNQVIIDELSQNVKTNDKTLEESLGWFISARKLDQKVEEALRINENEQKDLIRKEWKTNGHRH